MEHRYTKTTIGKIHSMIVSLTIPTVIIGMYLDYIQGKESNLWGFAISIVGFLLFLKAKISVIKSKKLFSLGCDLMDQRNTYFYFFGWLLMIAGYFLSWS